jgi:hypothetical protein
MPEAEVVDPQAMEQIPRRTQEIQELLEVLVVLVAVELLEN